MKMVYVFIDATKVVAGREGVEQWSAFEETEDDARAKVRSGYGLGAMCLELFNFFDDRRKVPNRRVEPRRQS